MPRGIPVATVAIGNAQNAGLLAVQIIASHDGKLQGKVQQYRLSLGQSVLEKQEKLDELGYEQYLGTAERRNTEIERREKRVLIENKLC